MEKADLAQAASSIRADWEAVVSELGDAGLERPGATDEWRVRDVLAHFNGWNRWQMVQLRNAFTGETATKDELEGGLNFPEQKEFPGEDGMNAMFYQANKDRALADVIADWREILDMREKWIAGASQEQVDDTIGADWAESRPGQVMRLTSEVPGATDPKPVSTFLLEQITHEREHLDIVRAWIRS